MVDLLKRFLRAVPWVSVLIYFVLVMAFSYFIDHRGLAWVDGVISAIVFGVVVVVVDYAIDRWRKRHNKQ